MSESLPRVTSTTVHQVVNLADDLEVPRLLVGSIKCCLIWEYGSTPKVVPTFRPSGATNHWKKQCFATFLTFRAPGSSFFWNFLFFDLLSSSLLFSESSHLCFSSVHIVESLTSILPSIVLYIYICNIMQSCMYNQQEIEYGSIKVQFYWGKWWHQPREGMGYAIMAQSPKDRIIQSCNPTAEGVLGFCSVSTTGTFSDQTLTKKVSSMGSSTRSVI